MIAIFIAPFYIALNIYLFWRIKGWVQAYFPKLKGKKGWIVPIVLYAFLASALVIAFFLPQGRFRRGMKLVGNYWLGVLLYMIFFIVIAELGRFLLLHVFRVSKDKICVPRVRRIVGCACATLIMCISFWGVVNARLVRVTPYDVTINKEAQDENGQKMSKSKGNAVDPFDALEKYGADAIRWYFYVNSAPWLPNRFHGKAVQEGQRKFMGTLWNTYAFFVLYANIDEFDATKYTLDYDKLSVMDKWLLSKMNTMIQTVDDNLANYRIPETARALQEFVDDMSNWYVRRSRERFWAKGMEQDKINAYMTLYHALVTIAKTAAPMIPFMTEDIYQNLVRSVDKDAPESIHLCDFPTVNEAWIDKDLEADMKELLEIVVLGRACRNTANIKNRQPIGTMYVKAEKKMSEFYTDIIADELNVKEVKFADDVESFISYSFKPQLRTVGPKYGKLLGGIRQALTDINGTAAMNELRTNGVLKLDINGNDVELTEEDLLIETAQTEGYVSESDGETSVVLDTNLTPELIEEGFVREIISKIQTMRKEAGFEVMDKIVVYAHGNDKIQDVMKAHEDEIKSEVLADEMVLGETDGYVKEWNINKEAVTMGVKKL